MEKFEASAGESFYSFVTRVKEHLRYSGTSSYTAEVCFNDISMFVRETSNVEDLSVIYNLKCELRNLKGE